MLRMEMYALGAWSAVDFEAVGFCRPRLQIGYSHPARLTFTLKQPQHEAPIPAYAGIKFWDDEALDADGLEFSAANPLFLGFVEDIDPADSNRLEYTCLDPTARAANKIPIMSTAWAGPSTEGDAAVPRLVLNATIDNDDDWQFARGFNLTVGQMIAILLDDAQLPLEAIFASGETAYEASDLVGLNYEPQEKIVFTGEPITSGILRLIDDWAPEWRMLFYPGTRKWRFGHLGAASPQVTYTLNDFSAASPHPVLKLNLDRTLEGRYTAVKIYGPEAVENVDISLSGLDLLDVSDGPVLETYGAGAVVRGKNKYQIADSTKWRMGRLLATPINAPLEEVRIGPNAWTQFSMWTRTPTLMARYTNGNNGTDAWQAVTGWVYDSSTGIIDFKDHYLYRYNSNPPISGGIQQPHYEVPSDVRLVYPSYIDPLFVRLPAGGGWEGTAYTQHELESELKIYDESLAVGFLFGTPVTSATRIAKFAILAQAILDSKKDALYHGGMTLEGIDYEFHRLFRRVNIAAVNGDGLALTTGWEQMKAIVTDVEYDWEEQITVVSFSSDQSELLGFDPARIKQQLRVDAEYISTIVSVWYQFGTHRAFTELGTPYLAQSLTVGGSITPVAVDPFFGTVDALIG